MKHTLALAALMAGLATSAMAAPLTVCLEGAPETFNPQLTSNGTTATVLEQIYDGLVTVEPGGSQIVPALAERWDVSQDGRTYTFHLRKGVKWQTTADFTPSREFNADDVMFTFDRMMKPDHPYRQVNGGSYITFNTKLADELSKVEKIDDYTVAFTLKKALAPFLGIMAHGSLKITSAEYADKLLAAGTPELFDRNPVGVGARSAGIGRRMCNIVFPEPGRCQGDTRQRKPGPRKGQGRIVRVYLVQLHHGQVQRHPRAPGARSSHQHEVARQCGVRRHGARDRSGHPAVPLG
jgi:hypothetical protein